MGAIAVTAAIAHSARPIRVGDCWIALVAERCLLLSGRAARLCKRVEESGDAHYASIGPLGVVAALHRPVAPRNRSPLRGEPGGGMLRRLALQPVASGLDPPGEVERRALLQVPLAGPFASRS